MSDDTKGYRGFSSKKAYENYYSDPAKYAEEIPMMEEYTRETEKELAEANAMRDDDSLNKIPVFAMERDDYSADVKPIGFAENETQAARLIRRYLAETTGDGDTGITAASIVYSGNAYFIEG